MFFFAMPFYGQIKLSDEHTEYKWLTYEKAEKLVHFSDQKIPLWELKERLSRRNLVR
jgi:dATP pyrophosphohydrolase